MISLLTIIMSLALVSCEIPVPEQQEEQKQEQQKEDPKPENAKTENPGDNNTSMTMNITVGDRTITATLSDNASAQQLAARLKNGAVTVNMMANGFEHYGSLGFSLNSDNRQVNAVSGDIMLYNSSYICIFYGSNSWSYTPLGKVDGLSAAELKSFFGSGDCHVTISMK